MMFDLTPLQFGFESLLPGLAIAAGLGFAIGILAAAFGIGGGIVITPFLHGIVQLPAGLAVATSMGQIPLMSLSGVIRYARAQAIDYRLAWMLLLGSIPSAQVVAHWLASSPPTAAAVWRGQSLADLILLVCFTVCIGGFGLYNLWRSRAPMPEGTLRASVPDAWRLPLNLLVGAGLGALSALLGIGSGLFAVPYLVFVCGLTPARGVATSLFIVFVTSLVTTLHYLWLGKIFFGISLVIACGSIIGAQIGAHMALKAQPHKLLRAMGIMQVAVCVLYFMLRVD